MHLDDSVANAYASSAKVLADRGIGIVKRRIVDGIYVAKIEDGIKLIKAAQRDDPNVDLSGIAEIVYTQFRTISSLMERDIREAYRVAREVGCSLDQERLAQLAYSSITNSGDTLLRLAEELEISMDPTKIAQEVYHVLARDNLKPEYFWGRAFDALIYAESKGATVDKTKLPEAERIEPVITYLLGHQEENAAVKYLTALKRWDIRLATDETIARLEGTANLLKRALA